MAVRDRVTGKFVDFRVTPKGEAASQRLPSKVVAVYTALALGALAPVLLMTNVGEARGFHILSGLNALIYAGIVVSVVVRHLRDNASEWRRHWHVAAFQMGSVVSLTVLIGMAVTSRGVESLYALSIGLEPFQIARAEYSVAGAGMNDYRRVHFRFDPGWN